MASAAHLPYELGVEIRKCMLTNTNLIHYRLNLSVLTNARTHSKGSLAFTCFFTTFLFDTTFFLTGNCCSVYSFVFSDNWSGCEGVLFTGVRTLPLSPMISDVPMFLASETCGDRGSWRMLLFSVYLLRSCDC